MTYDLLIVGGGIWGAGALHAAAREGVRCALLLEADIGLAQESSAKSGGIVTDLLWHPEDQTFVQRSRELFTEALRRSGDVSIVQPYGMLTLAEGEHIDALHRRTEDLKAREVPYELFDQAEVERRYPALDRLNPDTVALWLPGDWHVNATAFAQQVQEDARSEGLEVRTACRAESIRVEDGKVLVTACGEVFAARRVLVTAGTWTRRLVRTAGVDIPLRPYLVQASSLELRRRHGLPIVWHLSTDVYMVPDGEEDFLAGDGTRTREFDPDNFPRMGDEDFKATIAERLMQLSSLGDVAGLRSNWAGLCGGTPDRRPLVGEVAPGLFVATGDQGLGVMRGPAIGEFALRIALGLAEAPHLRPDRFPPTDFEIRAGFTLD